MPPSRKYPRRDFKAMSELLQSMGIMNYGRQVLPFMIEFTHNYVNSVLDEADQLAMRSNKKMFDVSDVRNAIKNVREKLYYKEPVPMKAAVGKNSNSSVKNLKPESYSSIIGNTINSSETPIVPVPSTSDMGNCVYMVLDEANDTETSSDEDLVVSSHARAIKNKRNNKPYKRSPVKKKVTAANSHLSEEVNENKPTLTTIDASRDYPVITTAPSTSPVEDNERSLMDEINESSTRSGEQALGLSSEQKETKLEGDKLEAGSPTKERITRTRCRQTTEITKPKPLPTSSTSEVDSNTQSSILPSTSCAENSNLDETSESGTSCSKKASDISSVCKSTKNKRNELEEQGPAKKKRTRAGSSSRREANEPKPFLASSTVEVDSKSQSSVVAVPSTSSAHDDVHNETNGLATDCDKKTSVSGVKRKARTRKNKSNNEESQPVKKITKTSSPKTTGRYMLKPITASSMFKVDPIPVAKVTKTYSRKPTGKNKLKSFLLPSIFEAGKIFENSAITLPATSCADLAHTISDESNKLTTNTKKKPNSPIRRTTRINRSNVGNKESPSKEGTKAPLTVRNKRKTLPLSSIKKEADNDVQGPVAKLPSTSCKVIGLEDYVHSVMSEEDGSTSNHNIKPSGVLSPQKRTKTQKIKVEPVSNSQSAASTVPSAGYGDSILKLLEMYEAEENKNKGVKVEKDDETEVSSADVNNMKSPIIVRIKQEVVEDDDYDKN